MKFIILLCAVIFTITFVNYKFSKIARIIAFGEEESPTERNWSFLLSILIAIFWTVYYFYFA